MSSHSEKYAANNNRSSSSSSSSSIIYTLFDRSNGTKRMSVSHLPSRASSRVDEAYSNMLRGIKVLETALRSKSWRQMENAVELIILKLLENHNPDSLFTVTPSKRLEREFFVMFGGMRLLLMVLEPPLSKPDARQILSSTIQRHVELWNEVLVILREVCFAVPTLADSIFSDSHLVFLFTLLSHDYVFENTMNLLEEILAVRRDTFCLSLVPDFFQLVQRLSARRLAHFCRVLALLLFEPEDRQIMENSQLLRSFELLVLRRDRMSKKSSAEVERNQSLVIDTPHLFRRLLTLMRIVNHGPTVSELVAQDIQMPSTFTTEFLMFMNSNRQQSEWDHYDALEESVRAAENPAPPPLPHAQQQKSRSGVRSTGSSRVDAPQTLTSSTSANTSTPSSSAANTGGGTTFTAAAAARMSSIFSGVGGGFLPRDITDSAYFGLDELNSDDEVDDISVAALSGTPATSRQDFFMNDVRDQMQESLLNMIQALQPSQQQQQQVPYPPSLSQSTARRSTGSGSGGPESSVPPSPVADLATVTAARNELQFQAITLAPHQVEVLFVLCTLLSGRRKIDVQARFASLGLGDILVRMFHRMSWEAPPFQGHNPMEHIHGPNCECNPESALRVQYLRLVHNFVDRDFHNNPIKEGFLSPDEHSDIVTNQRKVVCAEEEKSALSPGSRQSVSPRTSGSSGSASLKTNSSKQNHNNNKDEVESDVSSTAGSMTGLLMKITKVLIKEPFDSVYRFWLSSCVESFLRGAGGAEQCFLVRQSGVLDHLIHHICHADSSSSSASISNLQTSFDLLGELVKYNVDVVELLEAKLLQTRSMETFLDVILSNLVDSNVFLRSLVLTIEKMGHRYFFTSSSISDVSDKDKRNHHEELDDFTSPCFLPSSCLCPTGSGGRGFLPMSAGLAATCRDTSSQASKFNSNSNSNLGTSRRKSPVATPTPPLAPVSYLTHSWVHYAPAMISSEAERVAQQYLKTCSVSEKKMSNKKKNGKKSPVASSLLKESSSSLLSPLSDRSICESGKSSLDRRSSQTRADAAGINSSSSSSSSVSRLSSYDTTSFTSLTGSMRDAFQSIKEVTNNFMRSHKLEEIEPRASTSPAPDFGYRMTSARSTSSNASLYDFKDTVEVSQISLYDFKDAIEEYEQELKNANQQSNRLLENSLVKEEAVGRVTSYLPTSSSACKEAVDNESNIGCSLHLKNNNGVTKPQRVQITAATRTEESVCNLLHDAEIILSPSSRNLSSFLHVHRPELVYRLMCVVTLRSINHENICCINTTLLILIFSNKMGCLGNLMHGLKHLATSSHNNKKIKSFQQNAQVDDYVNNSHSSRQVQPLLLYSNGLRNFRELLWYWTEYYLRRGRDRLSLEFSTHIAFDEWCHVVGLLCADDDSATSLLQGPIPLPQTPYVDNFEYTFSRYY